MFSFKLPAELQCLVVEVEVNAVHIPTNTSLKNSLKKVVREASALSIRLLGKSNCKMPS